MKYCIQRPGLGLYHLMIMLLTLVAFASHSAPWPRQISDSKGVHTLTSRPLRIVSTSVTLTGSLLAIDAPVIASGATTPNNRFADDQGFLRQWSEVAKERKLSRLYIGEPSAEAVAAQMPDLILISATGGDSAMMLYDQLSTIAPTLIINYDDKSWQALLTQLGLIDHYRSWLGSPESALNAVMLADIWKNYPLITLLVLAALQSIPEDLYEAARLDGAGSLGLLRHVEAPLALPSLLGGFKNGFALSVTGAVVGEMVMGGSGLGTVLTVQRDAVDTTGMFATIAWLCVIAATAYSLITWWERRSAIVEALT